MEIQSICAISRLLGAPYRTNVCMSRALASGIETAGNLGVAAIESGVNYKINKNTNETNQRIAREANAAQAQLQADQNAWNLNMWEKENAYNTPEAQMQRLVEAGINPNMVGSIGITGNATSPAQGVDPMPLNVPDINPFSVDLSGALDLAMKAANIQNIQSQTKGQDLSNEFDAQSFATRLEAKQAALHQLTLQNTDLANALPFNQVFRGQKKVYNDLVNHQMEMDNKLIDETFEDRKKQMHWASKISERQFEDFEKRWHYLDEQIQHMDQQELLWEAQKHHWANQDKIASELTSQEINQMRQQMFYTRVQASLGILGIPTPYRKAFMETLASEGIEGMQEGLKKIPWNGDGNNWTQSFFKHAENRGATNWLDNLLGITPDPELTGTAGNADSPVLERGTSGIR